MISKNIQLLSINDVKEFVNTATLTDFEIDLVSGRYTVDAKSIMGIFSLDLLSPIKLCAQTDKEEDVKALLDDLKAFIVNE